MEILTWRFLFLILLTIGERKCGCSVTLPPEQRPMVRNVTVFGNDFENEVTTSLYPSTDPPNHALNSSETQIKLTATHGNETSSNQTCMGVVTAKMEDCKGDVERPNEQKDEDDGIVSRADYDTVVLVTGYTMMPLFVCSTILNVLNIVVFSQKTTTSSTFIVAISIADIAWNLVTAVVQVVPIFIQTRGDFRTNSLIFMYFGVLLRRMDLSLNALISVDRLLVLSGGIASRNVMQRYPKYTVCVIGLVVSALTFFDAYAIILGQTGTLSLMNASLTNTSATNQTDLDMNETVLGKGGEGECSGNNENADGGGHISDSGSNPGVIPQSDADVLSNSTSKCNTTNIPIEPAKSVTDTVFKGIAMFNKATVYAILLLMMVLNTVTLVFLKKQARMRTVLGISTPIDQRKQDERRQIVILLTMTTVYVFLGIPRTSVSLIRDLHIWPEFEIGKKEKYLLVSLMKCVMLSEIIKNSSDFVVYFVMSRSFTSALKDAVGHIRPRRNSPTPTSHSQA